MATGRCTNIMKCSKAKNKEIQEADKANFVCAECGKPLMEVNTPPTGPKVGPNITDGGITPPPPPVKWKLLALIATIIAVVVIAIVFIMKKNGTQSEPTIISPSDISLSKEKCEMKVGETDTLQAILSPDSAQAQLKWATNDTTVVKVVDGVVTALSPGTAKVGVQVMENKALKAFCEYTVKKKQETKGGSNPVEAKSVLGGVATLSDNTITFRHTYVLDLKTMDGEELLIGRGDRIKEAKIKNGHLLSGIYVSSYGNERYISGLNVKL